MLKVSACTAKPPRAMGSYLQPPQGSGLARDTITDTVDLLLPEGIPDVSTAFLANPEKAREALQLAVRLCKRRTPGTGMAMGPPGTEGAMHRGGGGGSGAGGQHRSMHDRLQRLALLVQRGILTASEGDRLRVRVSKQLQRLGSGSLAQRVQQHRMQGCWGADSTVQPIPEGSLVLFSTSSPPLLVQTSPVP